MAKIPVNLLGIEPAGTFPVYPPGRYRLIVTDSRTETARSSGEAKQTIFLEIVEGPNGGQEYVGQRMVRGYSLQPQALGFFRRFVNACGISDADLQRNGGSPESEWLIGAVIEAEVAIRKDPTGRDRNDISNEDPVSARGQAAVQPAPMAFQPVPQGNPQVSAQQPYAGAGYQTQPAQTYQAQPAQQMQPAPQMQAAPTYTAPAPGAYAPGFAPQTAPPLGGNGQNAAVPPAPAPPPASPPARASAATRGGRR